MERRILFISLLPTAALAFALAVGHLEDEPTPAAPSVAVRTGTTVVTPATADRTSLATLEPRGSR